MLSPPSFSMSTLLALCFRSKSSQSFFRGLTWILVYCASSDLNLSIRISIPRRSCTASTFKKTKVLSKIEILHVTNINYCIVRKDTLRLESASTKRGCTISSNLSSNTSSCFLTFANSATWKKLFNKKKEQVVYAVCDFLQRIKHLSNCWQAMSHRCQGFCSLWKITTRKHILNTLAQLS